MPEMDEVCRECPVQKTRTGPMCTAKDMHDCPDHRGWEEYRRGLKEGEAKKAAEAEAVVQADAGDLWRVTNAIRKAIEARQWITDGRGQYLFDDVRYREETRRAFGEIVSLIDGVQPPAQRRFFEFMAAGALQRVIDRTEAQARVQALEEVVRWLEMEDTHKGLDGVTVATLEARLIARLANERITAASKGWVEGGAFLRMAEDPRWPKDAFGRPLQ